MTKLIVPAISVADKSTFEITEEMIDRAIVEFGRINPDAIDYAPHEQSVRAMRAAFMAAFMVVSSE